MTVRRESGPAIDLGGDVVVNGVSHMRGLRERHVALLQD